MGAAMHGEGVGSKRVLQSNGVRRVVRGGCRFHAQVEQEINEGTTKTWIGTVASEQAMPCHGFESLPRLMLSDEGGVEGNT